MESIPVSPLELLQTLAGLAQSVPPLNREGNANPLPVPVAAGSGHAPSRFTETSSLGPVDIDRYLSHYGVPTRGTKPTPNGGGTMHILENCIFNPDHSGGQASIIVWPNGISYQCFHASCSSQKWADARQRISGDEKINRFCAGYDPDWKPPAKRGRPAKQQGPTGGGEAGNGGNGSDPQQQAADAIVEMKDVSGRYRETQVRSPLVDAGNNNHAGEAVPSPLEVNVMEFYHFTGKRTEFVPRFAANYLVELLHPVAYTAGSFWRYADGVWRTFPRDDLISVCVGMMKEKMQARMIESVLLILQGLVYKPEPLWDQDPMLINIKNGMYHIEKDEMVPHDPAYLSRVQLPVNFDPKAKVTDWWAFLESIFPDDMEKDEQGKYKHYLAKHLLAMQYGGYCLLRDTRHQKALFLYGTGSNGKSTFLNAFGAVLGPENTVSLSLTSLGERFKSQYLHNKLVNLASETNPKEAMEADIFNSVVAGDEITAERKYGDSFKFRPYCKFIISMNETPVVQDKSYAFERRVLVLNFTRRFTKDEIDPQMSDKLVAEKDGIFYWMVEGLRILLRNNRFVIEENIQKEIENLMHRVNPFLIFIEECAYVEPGQRCNTTDIWEAYRDWCAEGGNRSLGRNKFYDMILMQFPAVKKTTDPEGRTRIFDGIGLNSLGIDDMRSRLRRKYGRD